MYWLGKVGQKLHLKFSLNRMYNILTMKEKIEIPENCPACNSTLIMEGPQLYCKNSYCPAKTSKIVESFCKNMKIKGFGPKTVEKLNLTSIVELYDLTRQKMINLLGETMGDKLYRQLEISKSTSFGTLLGSLSIPRIGVNTANKIAEKYNSFDELKESLYADNHVPSVTTALQNWFDNEYPLLEDLLSSFNLEPQTQVKPSDNGKTVCITGKLALFTKAQATQKLESLGFRVTSAVSKKTDILICDNPKNSSKEKKAEELNIPIITFKEIENYV